MAYARFGSDSYVYVYRSSLHEGQLVCQACHLIDGGLYVATTPTDMIEHLREHQAVGQLVPEDTFVRLQEEE